MRSRPLPSRCRAALLVEQRPQHRLSGRPAPLRARRVRKPDAPRTRSGETPDPGGRSRNRGRRRGERPGPEEDAGTVQQQAHGLRPDAGPGDLDLRMALRQEAERASSCSANSARITSGSAGRCAGYSNSRGPGRPSGCWSTFRGRGLLQPACCSPYLFTCAFPLEGKGVRTSRGMLPLSSAFLFWFSGTSR